MDRNGARYVIGYGVTVMMNTDCSKLRDRILETVFAELITG